MSNPETILTNRILIALGRDCSGLCRVWRQNSGSFRQLHADRVVRAGVAGCADITGILADGRRLELEVKHGLRQQSSTQRIYMDMVVLMRGCYQIVRSPEEAVAYVRSCFTGAAHE